LGARSAPSQFIFLKQWRDSNANRAPSECEDKAAWMRPKARWAGVETRSRDGDESRPNPPFGTKLAFLFREKKSKQKKSCLQKHWIRTAPLAPQGASRVSAERRKKQGGLRSPILNISSSAQLLIFHAHRILHERKSK
jgi:hypothetical protein